ncbi:MAG TPA: PQQ-binding-like beta-propeller repeat protein [Kiritimatiellia bacterium]|nr:PQQ-binding-like beta-propeller repeat protein [Kiritimatiellia bacterium]
MVLGEGFGERAWYRHPWPTHHRDGSNSDRSPLVVSPDVRIQNYVLGGNAVLTAPVIDAQGRWFVTTGKNQWQGNLHAFNREGRRLWSQGAMDSLAVTGTPILDEGGRLYAGDGRFLRALDPADGRIVWQATIPAPLVTPVLLSGNRVGGITVNGDVVVVDRDTGANRAAPLRIGGPGPEAPARFPGLWAGLMDPAIIDTVFAGLVGFDVVIANTPAVHPRGDRMFILAGNGVLYGLDVGGAAVSVRFATTLGEGSGTSPALSPDGGVVYAGDGAGWLYAVDGSSGAVRWRVFTGPSFASPSVDGAGRVLVQAGSRIVVVSPVGQVLWARDYSWLASQTLGSRWIDGVRVDADLQFVSALTLAANAILVQADLGFPVERPPARRLILPVQSVLLFLDLQTGLPLAAPVSLPDSGGGVVSLDDAGRIYVPHGALLTSVAESVLTPGQRAVLGLLSPVGGVTVLEPRVPRQVYDANVSAAVAAITMAERALVDGDVSGATEATLAAQALVRAVSSLQAGGLPGRTLPAGRLALSVVILDRVERMLDAPGPEGLRRARQGLLLTRFLLR